MKDALKLALEALQHSHANEPIWKTPHQEAITAIKQALAAPVQEPVAWQHKKPICDSQGETLGYSDWKDGKGLCWWPRRALYTTPPAAQRQWVGLTPQEVHAIWSAVNPDWHTPRGAVSAIYEHIEAKLKEKNT